MKRLWVDANIILRFVTKDPPPLAERAARLMTRAERGEVTLHLAPLVLAEIIWVLKSFYRYPMSDIAQVIIALVSASGVEVDDRTQCIRAIELARDQNVDFIDAYLAVQAAAHGEPVCTFYTTDFKRLPAEWMTPTNGISYGVRAQSWRLLTPGAEALKVFVSPSGPSG